jgi:hypothetical protein
MPSETGHQDQKIERVGHSQTRQSSQTAALGAREQLEGQTLALP